MKLLKLRKRFILLWNMQVAVRINATINKLNNLCGFIGEVFDYLVAHGRMKEKEARSKFRQVRLNI